ncbi:hypothetical protein TNCV_629001 [Trichonephila clavipes]|nr:hypothetical protein TNCV_629001 [Trichonephila clavipes]
MGHIPNLDHYYLVDMMCEPFSFFKAFEHLVPGHHKAVLLLEESLVWHKTAMRILVKVEPHYVNTHQFLNLKAFPPRPPWNSSVFNGYTAKLSSRMIVIKMGKGKFIYDHRRSNHGMELKSVMEKWGRRNEDGKTEIGTKKWGTEKWETPIGKWRN